MAEFLPIMFKVMAIYLAFFIGYLARLFRGNKINLDTITELIIYVGSPCLIFSKISTAHYNFKEVGILFSAVLFLVAGIALLNILMSLCLRRKFSNIYYVATMFMNTANVGFPVTLLILGTAGFQKALILDLAMVIILFSFGVWLISKDFWQWLKLPVLYAAGLAFFISFQQIHIPQAILKPIAMLGDITVPLMIISLGCKIADIKMIRHYRIPIAATMVRSGLGFLLGLVFVYLLKITGITRDVILLYAALPAPMMTYVLAQKYHQDEELGAEIVLVSNVLAILILPIVIYGIKYLI